VLDISWRRVQILSDASGCVRFEFSMIREIPPLGAFAVDPVTGRLATTRQLDREQIGSHQLIICATDIDRPDLTSQVNVTVYVADKNDNAPVISFPSPDNNTVEVSFFTISLSKS
jgi:protocadherin delta 1